MKPEQLLAILYEMAIVVGGEVRLLPLLTKTLQRLLFHTAFPCGVILLRSEAGASGGNGDETTEVRLETSIGDADLAAHHGAIVAVPEVLLRGEVELGDAGGLPESIPCRRDYYRVFLRLPIDDDGVILLLAPWVPETGLPLTQIFQPVMNNFAKAVRLCRSYEAYTEGIITDQRMAEAALKDMSYRHRLILDSVGEGICGLDLEGRATFVNPAAARLLGFEPGELEGRIPHEIIGHSHGNGSEISFAECPIIRAMREGRIHRMASDLFRRRDGSTFPVEYVATPLRDDGRILGAVLVFQDITERRRAEEDIRRLAAIVESSDDAIISKTLDGVILTWNRGAERVYGYTAEEMKGEPISRLVPPGQENEIPDILDRIKRGEVIEHYETKRVRKDGTVIDVSLTVSPVKSAEGAVVAASSIARDITGRKRVEEALQRLNEELEQRVRDRTTDLEEKNAELERLNRIFIGRELRMVELKQKIRELEESGGEDGS